MKWSGKKFDNIELDTSKPLSSFKDQLFSLSNVDPSRQKVLYKGKTLKDDEILSQLNISEGQVFMLIGSSQLIPEPASKDSNINSDRSSSKEDTGASLVKHQIVPNILTIET